MMSFETVTLSVTLVLTGRTSTPGARRDTSGVTLALPAVAAAAVDAAAVLLLLPLPLSAAAAAVAAVAVSDAPRPVVTLWLTVQV
jgi:hypothetical protein